MAAYIQCPGAVWLLVTGISAVLPVLTTYWCVYCHCVAYFPFLVITRHYTLWVQRSSDFVDACNSISLISPNHNTIFYK